MGNSITHTSRPCATDLLKSNAKLGSSLPNSDSHKRSVYYSQHRQHQHAHQYKSKTLPIRSNSAKSTSRPANKRYTLKSQPSSSRSSPTKRQETRPNGDTSRILFLLYLVHRTWNVVVETVDSKSKRSRRSAEPPVFDKNTAKAKPSKYFGDSSDDIRHDFTLRVTDLDDIDASSACCSHYSFCSCSNCDGKETQNVYNTIADDCSTDSIDHQSLSRSGSDFSTYYQGSYRMAPSGCQNSPKLAPHNAVSGTNIFIGASATTTTDSSIAHKSNCGGSSINGSIASYKMSSSANSWPQGGVYNKENQRPPVYNPEDYAQSLKKLGKRHSGQNARSIYDASELISSENSSANDNFKSATLPSKHADYKSPILSPPKSESEMSLRQFASITDLLTKLRADLRLSFPSFVQEFIASPLDGISLLLEILRAVQLTQATNSLLPLTAQMTMPRNSQSYQRRALLDELACLQCLMICCTRSPEATARLGTTPVGLIPLATSATGQGIRARILALQLLTAACDKHSLGHGSQKAVTAGHTAVSEAMSTLRLRCSEPVRFRLLVGMLNSGGTSGELQAIGVKFVNTFLESAASLQQRLYLQAELFQAGLEPAQMAKTLSSSSPWLDILRLEIKRFNELYVDVDKMITQARDADRVRSQMVILERRVQILHDEKAVLTSMERRLQERCAELQREIFRLQGAQSENSFKSLDKQPNALPCFVPPKKNASEHEDEGISSSETGPSLSPVPILALPKETNAHTKTAKLNRQQNAQSAVRIQNSNDEDTTAIENVIGELDNVVSEAERQITLSIIGKDGNSKEKDIVPVNIVPQPPRKARSLAHLVSKADGSCELDGSEYGLLMVQNHGADVDQKAHERVQTLDNFFDETDDYSHAAVDKLYPMTESPDIPEVHASTIAYNASTTRELLDVIMNARQGEDDPTMKAFREAQNQPTPVKKSQNAALPAQQFNGVFFMTGMNTPQKYPKPDLTAALQAKRVTKNLERLKAFASQESLHENSVIIGVHTAMREKSKSNQQIYFGMRLEGSTNGGCLQQPQQTIHTVTAAQILQGNNKINNTSNINKQQISTRTRSYTQGSKVTDVISGLY